MNNLLIFNNIESLTEIIMERCVVFLLIVIFGLINQAEAARPIISEHPVSMTHSKNITIKGSNFGIKTPAAPLRYDNFQNGSKGTRASSESEGGWYTATGVVYDNKYQRFNGDMSLQQNFNTNGGGYNQTIGLTGDVSLKNARKLYMHAWWRIDTWNHATRNCKILNLGSGIGSTGWDSRLDLHPAASNGLINIREGCPYDVQVADYIDETKALGDDGSWHRIDSWFDGEIGHRTIHVDNQLLGSVTHTPSTSVFSGCSEDYINYAYFGHYYTNDTYDPDPMAQRWYSELYVDITRARIEIGDNITFENCKHREIQIPTAWSGGSISFTSNQGSFKDGDTIYLFVINSDGEVSEGAKIILGNNDTTASDNPPSVNITAPTSNTNYVTDTNYITISGTASDDLDVSLVTWNNNLGGSGTALNVSGNWTSFSLENVSLQEGTNVISVTATDTEGQTATDTLTVTYSTLASTGSTDDSSAWNAFSQTGDTSWKDSSVTYCVRLLVEGSQIAGSANQVKLGFQGRSSGDYTIHGVSIAERDTSANEGDVIDSTWKQVTFDGASWTASTTIPQGTEKLSDPVAIDLKSGTDYYVTLKIESPSVYLNPPSGYRELYFYSADHTTDIDWSGNGHSVTQDYHALTKIYAYEADGGTTTVPAPEHLEVLTD
ncbi:hypothetical protein [Desulfosarcina variabilis]|uniref:hypothetical protein n=1 Tax=Desulfosarcina variabilis TaxID=2300 RepID=UPI003AFA69DB